MFVFSGFCTNLKKNRQITNFITYHVVVDHVVVVVDGVEDEDGGDDDEQAMEQKCLDSEAKDYDELMPRMALNLKNKI